MIFGAVCAPDWRNVKRDRKLATHRKRWASSLPQTQKCQRRLCRKAAAGALVRLLALLIGVVVVNVLLLLAIFIRRHIAFLEVDQVALGFFDGSMEKTS